MVDLTVGATQQWQEETGEIRCVSRTDAEFIYWHDLGDERERDTPLWLWSRMVREGRLTLLPLKTQA